MHVRELVELAALLSGHAEVLLADETQLTRDGMSEYWSASRARLDLWSRSLENLDGAASPVAAEHAFVPSVAEPLLHEIFASEVLTRLWAAVVSLVDRKSDRNAATAVARSVLIGHQDVRCRALKWILNGPFSEGPHADAVNLVRRRCERWTDVLIANVYHLGNVAEFTVDASRAAEFARDVADERRSGTYASAWSATMASLRATLQVGIAREGCSHEANRRIGGAVLACLGPDLFAPAGSLRSPWLNRLQRITEDTECMLNELLSAECPSSEGL